ncbi:MAG: DUF4160 domain-containing protein [Oscillospiraceae bacterium]|nr:DUF4160 domain-containing protein [Oscillospiraceae bacterium]
MPELSRFYGIKICMYFEDDEQHHKPHIHVFYGEYEAVLDFDGIMLVGSLPSKQYRLVSGWIALHEDELYRAWNEAVRGKNPNKITPLTKR